MTRARTCNTYTRTFFIIFKIIVKIYKLSACDLASAQSVTSCNLNRPIQAITRRVDSYRSRHRVAHWVNVCCSPFPIVLNHLLNLFILDARPDHRLRRCVWPNALTQEKTAVQGKINKLSKNKIN